MLLRKLEREEEFQAIDVVKWQLPEPGALMSAKAYRDKKAVLLVEKLKEVVKNLTFNVCSLRSRERS